MTKNVKICSISCRNLRSRTEDCSRDVSGIEDADSQLAAKDPGKGETASLQSVSVEPGVRFRPGRYRGTINVMNINLDMPFFGDSRPSD